MKKNVVVIDDDEFILTVVEKNLNKNFNVIKFLSPVEALQHINTHKDVDLIVTDYYMPELTGQELIDKVRESRTMPIILISGSATSVSGDNTTFIKKPFSFKAFMELAKNLTDEVAA